jgi:LPXTG-motif cell wall-anchored protein
MSGFRSAALALGVAAVLGPASNAAAAGSRLTQKPPVPLAGQHAREHASGPSSTGHSSALPRTGADLALEALAGAALAALGAVLRRRAAA